MENIPPKNTSDGLGFPNVLIEQPRGHLCKWSCVKTRTLVESLCDKCSDEIGAVETWEGLSVQGMISLFHRQVGDLKQDNASLRGKVQSLEQDNMSLKEEVNAMKLAMENMEKHWQEAFHTGQRRLEAWCLTTCQQLERKHGDAIRDIQKATTDKEKQLVLRLAEIFDDHPDVQNNLPDGASSFFNAAEVTQRHVDAETDQHTRIVDRLSLSEVVDIWGTALGPKSLHDLIGRDVI